MSDDNGDFYRYYMRGFTRIDREPFCAGINPDAPSDCFPDFELHMLRLAEWHNKVPEPELTENRKRELDYSEKKRRKKNALPQRA